MRGLTLLLAAVCVSTATADTFVYVSDSRGNAIKSYRVQDQDGTLTPVETLEVGGAPGSLNVDPSRRFLFASIRSTSAVTSFALDPSTGKLSQLSSAQLKDGANAAYVGTDRSGKFLLSASYSGGLVAVHAIGSDGKLSEKPLQLVETARTAHAAVASLDNQWVFVPHVAPNAVFQFRFEPQKGHLELHGQAPGGQENAGPRHLAIHPTGQYAFSSDETGSSITLYALDRETGLKPLQTVSTLPDGYAERNTTADVRVHPSGKFVWVSNRGHDSLAGFAFDSSQKRLTAIGQTPTEKTPRSFDVDPTGRYLYSGGEGTGKLAAYRIDAASGKLNRFQTYDVGTSLSWVCIVKPIGE